MASLVMSLKKLYRTVCTEQDFFGPFDLLLILPGFHLARGWHGLRVRLVFGAMRAIQLFSYLIWADRFVLALLNASANPGKALHYSNTFGVLSMMVARMLVFKWYVVDVERLQQYIRRQRAATPPATGSYRKIVKTAIIFQLIGLADRAVFVFSSTYRRELYEMPANVSRYGWMAELLVHIFSFDFAWRWAAAYNTSLTGMNSIMLGLSDELAEIAEDYRHLLVVEPGIDFWTQLERNIRRTVRRHEQFLQQLDLLKPFLRTTFLLMFYSAVIFLAIGMFMISANERPSTYDIILSGFLVTLLLECYWCCQLVDRLNDENDRIGEQLYGLEWPEQLCYSLPNAHRYRQARSSLLIMMSMTQKSLGITCGGMFEMSSEAFASLVKLTYTMLMFLRDTQHPN
ncbi:uncharacterized protein LOC131291097 [Anopheles ziemanni]|uniref:uncharacterized protein LOC131269306 n=1 Tax=Anopheles coustani TaxID=139045 RepID=UPI002659FC99|nr:uncharacterized protein LOC131269306 [Anopheles coustani]XP_058176271.1 uncharacterized protein LOC131291097 [Anopheles ziemanni]